MIRRILSALRPAPRYVDILAEQQHQLFAADTDTHDLPENAEWRTFLRNNLPERLRPFDGDYGDTK